MTPSHQDLPGPGYRIVALTALAMLAFASNSLLCRMALRETTIDATSFTLLRLCSGAGMLWLVLRVRGGAAPGGNWASALALFGYAAGFSLAYRDLTAGTGALLLFGAVQVVMIGRGLAGGERLRIPQWAGLALALLGLVGMLLPGLSAPPLAGALLMLGAGIAWGIYSLRGRGLADPVAESAGNFLRATPLALALAVVMPGGLGWDAAGVGYALASGALTSGLGYVLWYRVLPALRASQAATVQLSVPAITALAAAALLGEAPGWRLVLGSVAILGGVALVITRGRVDPGAAVMRSSRP